MDAGEAMASSASAFPNHGRNLREKPHYLRNLVENFRGQGFKLGLSMFGRKS